MGDVLVIMDDVQYDKRYTNRNRIMATNGWTWISVPINKDHKFLSNMMVEINNEIPWREYHWRKIYHSYANAKFFYLYENYFKSLYEKEWKFLFDLDLETMKKIIEWLGIKIKIIKESELNVKGTSTERLVNVCKIIGADTYVAGKGSQNYMDEKLFEKNNLKVEYQNYTPIQYPQYLSEYFVPDLSIIDMLFNVGPDSLKLVTGNTLQILNQK